jgi:hypothetical protein
MSVKKNVGLHIASLIYKFSAKLQKPEAADNTLKRVKIGPIPAKKFQNSLSIP